MTVHKIGSDQIRPATGLRPAGPGASREGVGRDGGAAPGSGEARPARADEVEISTEGRALAARMLGSDTSPARDLDLVRSRIERGHYDAPEVAEEVGRRLLASGDLETA